MKFLVSGELKVWCETCHSWWQIGVPADAEISSGKFVASFAFQVDRLRKEHVCDTADALPERPRHLKLV